MARKVEHIDEIETQIGTKIYELRIMLGLSRQELADRIFVTHQQLQKYEKGINRISAGRLLMIAKALNKPVSYFFENLEAANDDEAAQSEDAVEIRSQRKCIEASRNFMKIKNPQHQEAVSSLLKMLAD